MPTSFRRTPQFQRLPSIAPRLGAGLLVVGDDTVRRRVDQVNDAVAQLSEK